MPIVAAKCTNCGATLKIDSEVRAAICDYCRGAFVVEDAISEFRNSNIENVNIHESMVNIYSGESLNDRATNLARRALAFLDQDDIEKAEEYLEKAFDLDVENEMALQVKRDARLYLIKTPNCRFTSSCWGLAVVVHAFVDGYEVARLRDGQSADVVIPFPGKHEIAIKALGYGKCSVPVIIKNRHTFISVNAKYKRLAFRVQADVQVGERL